MKTWGLIISLVLCCAGCAVPPVTTGSLGFEDSRRVVVVGENFDPNIARYYQNKYQALVWFTPFQGRFVKNASNLLQSGFGPSIGMRSLIRELESINYTVGRWEIIVPKVSEAYFLATLKHMKARSLAKARGVIVLIDSANHRSMEEQVKRVTDDSFFVSYDFHK